MKTVGFIGVYDKIDLMIYIAKIITTLKKSVLIIDASTNQKARYIVPVISPTKEYVTEYEEIDIAVGFDNVEGIKRYLGTEELEYDIVLINVDSQVAFETFNLEEAPKNYFVTSFDLYSLRKGLEVVNGLKQALSLTKVLFSKDMIKEEDDYLNFLSLEKKIVWNEDRIYFPIENGDLSVIYENHRVSKVRFKKLSVAYKDGLTYIAEDILGSTSGSEIRRAVRTIEKGV